VIQKRERKKGKKKKKEETSSNPLNALKKLNQPLATLFRLNWFY
jgi:hypothetical protein